MESSNRRAVIALGGAFGLSLLVIAFLLGRLSAAPAAPTPGPPSTALLSPATGIAAVEPVTAPIPSAPVSTVPSSSGPNATPREFTPEITPAPSSAAAPVSVDSDRAQITAYFAQLDRLEDMGAGDPQAFASSMMQSLSTGDFSGFDELLAKARNQRQRLQATTPPSACVEHHRLALALSGESVTMLEQLKAALMKGDSMALMGIASEGRTLEARAIALKSLGEKIKRQAGI